MADGEEPEAVAEPEAGEADLLELQVPEDVIQRAIVVDELVSEVEPVAPETPQENPAPNVEELAQHRGRQQQDNHELDNCHAAFIASHCQPISSFL